jgi:hypothetical protein
MYISFLTLEVVIMKREDLSRHTGYTSHGFQGEQDMKAR